MEVPLTAVGTGRTIDFAQLDRPAVLLCFAEATQHDAEPIEAAIRERYTAAHVLVAHLVNLRAVPAAFRAVASSVLNAEYEKAVKALPAGETAEDYVVILPDWDGSFVRSLAFEEDVSKQLGVAVFDAAGTLLGTAQGPNGLAQQTLDWLAAALQPRPSS